MSTPTSFGLSGRVALITGGNGGIGRGIALGMAEAGASVAILGRNEEKNARVLAELKAIGAPSMAIAVDVTDRAALEPAFQQVEAELGPLGPARRACRSGDLPGFVRPGLRDRRDDPR